MTACFVKISFVALLVGNEEQLLVLALVLSISQEDLEGPDWTKRDEISIRGHGDGFPLLSYWMLLAVI